ncbi:MAG: glycosyltransferase family 4 protein [Mangrovibacterium sp.]
MIIMACANFPPEPVVAAALTYDLATELSDRYKVMVLTPRPSRPYGFSFEHGPGRKQKFGQTVLLSYTCSRSSLAGRMRESYSFGKYVSRYIRENRTEIEFVYICAWPLLAQYKIVKTAKKMGIPSVVHIEDIYPESLSNKIPVFGNMIRQILLPMDVFILKAASKVIAVSENMKISFIQTRGISADKITLIRNWQDESEFVAYRALKERERLSDQESKPFIFMYLGNIGPVAGVDFIIRSFALANLSDARLVIAGSGSMKAACYEIASSYQNANIIFEDVPAGKVPEIQDQADVMLLPVRRRGAMSSIPSKLSAYLFSEKPVIACVEENSDTAHTIRSANCGWIVPPEDSVKLVETFQMVFSITKPELHRYGINGFRYAEENFSKKKNLKKLVHLINEVINS